MPAAGVVVVPVGLTRIASSRADFHIKKDASVDACGTDAWRPLTTHDAGQSTSISDFSLRVCYRGECAQRQGSAEAV
jgi:hypothetical protein